MSVAYVGPKSRTERPRKTKIDAEVAHVTRDSDTTFKVKRSGSQGAGEYCGGLPQFVWLLLQYCKRIVPSVLWHYWLDNRKGIRPVTKNGLLVLRRRWPDWSFATAQFSSVVVAITAASIVSCCIRTVWLAGTGLTRLWWNRAFSDRHGLLQGVDRGIQLFPQVAPTSPVGHRDQHYVCGENSLYCGR